MLLYVYRLRQRGARLDRVALRNEGVRGDLRLVPVTAGWGGKTVTMAHLLDPASGRDLLPPLEHGQVVRIREAITVSGREVLVRGRKSGGERYVQTWVCSAAPIPPAAWPAPAPAASATGFDSADDDAAA